MMLTYERRAPRNPRWRWRPPQHWNVGGTVAKNAPQVRFGRWTKQKCLVRRMLCVRVCMLCAERTGGVITVLSKVTWPHGLAMCALLWWWWCGRRRTNIRTFYWRNGNMLSYSKFAWFLCVPLCALAHSFKRRIANANLRRSSSICGRYWCSRQVL